MKKLVAIHLALGFALGPAVEASASETPDQHVAQQRAALPPAAMQAAQAMLAQRSGGFSVGTGVRGQAASLTRFGDIQADTQYPIASASKFLAAATVMAVVDEGKLQLDAPIATWLPTLPPAAGKLTLRQLLSQTSGLAGVKGEYYDLAQDHRITLEQSAMDVTQRPLISVPGEVFAYGSAGFQLAGAAVEAATGQRWAQVFQDKIATPLGMTRTYWTHLRLDSADELPLTDEQGGPRRLLAVLGDAWADSARRGQAVVALMDQGPYLVQRQAIHTAPATAQWLATPRGDSTGVTLDLPDEPEGMTYDLASGQVRPGGRGVRIYALSVHADIPRRPGRHGLDAIEQHAMLRASSLRMEWPRQAGDVLEVTGGKLLVWASDATQRFPSGFGTDGRLFTPDDPMVALPRGYTLVTLDPQGFRFDRSREIALAFHPVQPTADIDYSRLAPADAATALVALVAEHHPQATRPDVDLSAFRADYAARFRAAAERRDIDAQAQLLVELGQRLRDGQYRVRLPDGRAWPIRADRGLGALTLARGAVNHPMPRVWLRDDGRLMVTAVAPGSPAAQAGLQPGSEILAINGEKPSHYLDRLAPTSLHATGHERKLDVTPLDLGTPPTLSLRARAPSGQEQDLHIVSVPAATPTPAEPSLSAFQLRSARGGNYAYIALNSFVDGATGQLLRWENSLAAATQARAEGLIIDLRAHQGDNHQLVAHMLASLYPSNHPLRLANSAQRTFDPTARVWRSRGALGLPPNSPWPQQAPHSTARSWCLPAKAALAPASCSPLGFNPASAPTSWQPTPQQVPWARPCACISPAGYRCNYLCWKKPAQPPKTLQPDCKDAVWHPGCACL